MSERSKFGILYRCGCHPPSMEDIPARCPIHNVGIKYNFYKEDFLDPKKNRGKLIARKGEEGAAASEDATP